MLKFFGIFYEYGDLGPNRLFTLSWDKNWNWFKVCVFTKEKIDLAKN